MSDTKQRVRDIAEAIELTIPEDRLEHLALLWEQALAEAELAGENPTPPLAPSRFDATWGDKR